MTWFRVDDGFADHPKVLALQESKHWKGALALWTLAGSWSSRHLTDGAIPRAVVTRLGASKQEAEALVTVGLWVPTDDGYQFHGWDERNPSREHVEAKRATVRERVTRYREKRAGNADCNALQEHNSNATVTPPPTRPDPTRPFKDQNTLVELASAEAGEASAHGQPSRAARGSVDRIFDRWRELFEHPKSKLDRKRRGVIERAVKSHGEQTCLDSLEGYSRDAFTLGENDRHKRFDDIELLLRDAQHIERGLTLAEGTGRGAETLKAERDEWWREVMRWKAEFNKARLERREEDAKHADERARAIESAGPGRWKESQRRTNGSGTAALSRDHLAGAFAGAFGLPRGAGQSAG